MHWDIVGGSGPGRDPHRACGSGQEKARGSGGKQKPGSVASDTEGPRRASWAAALLHPLQTATSPSRLPKPWSHTWPVHLRASRASENSLVWDLLPVPPHLPHSGRPGPPSPIPQRPSQSPLTYPPAPIPVPFTYSPAAFRVPSHLPTPSACPSPPSCTPQHPSRSPVTYPSAPVPVLPHVPPSGCLSPPHLPPAAMLPLATPGFHSMEFSTSSFRVLSDTSVLCFLPPRVDALWVLGLGLFCSWL